MEVALTSAIVGGVIGSLTAGLISVFIYFKQKRDEVRSIAASLSIETKHLYDGLVHYKQLIEGVRSAAFYLNEPAHLPDSPFKKSDFRIFNNNATHIGRLPAKEARALVPGITNG